MRVYKLIAQTDAGPMVNWDEVRAKIVGSVEQLSQAPIGEVGWLRDVFLQRNISFWGDEHLHGVALPRGCPLVALDESEGAVTERKAAWASLTDIDKQMLGLT